MKQGTRHRVLLLVTVVVLCFVFAGCPEPTVPPMASFAGTPLSGDAPLTVAFTDTSAPGSAPIDTFQWQFGDGGISTVQNPTHQYTTPGVYAISLTVITEDGTDNELRYDYITVNDPRADVVIIYYNERDEAEVVGGILEASGLTVRYIHQNAIDTTDFSNFSAIVICPDAYDVDPWPDLNLLDASGLPIIGLGGGGYIPFSRMGLPIGACGGSEPATVDVVSPHHAIFTTPYNFGLEEGAELDVCALGMDCHADVTYLGGIPDGTDYVVLLRTQSGMSYSPLVYQDDRFCLWGWSGSAGNLTVLGQKLLQNVVHFFVGL